MTVNEKIVKGITTGATLVNNPKKEKENLKTVNVYGIPAEWIGAIKDKGYSFAAFARHAIEEKMKREGLLK